MITVKNLELSIKNQNILTDINAVFEDGKIYGIVGNNGSGKTMLIKCICGFVRLTSGEILVNGKQIGKDVDYIHDAGIIIETPVFISHYSGFANLKVLASINKKINDNEIRDAMSRCGLNPLLRKPVRKYSLGMKQRLAIAQAIMEHPHIYLLDEPMNGLDYEGVIAVRGILKKLKEEGNLIILVCHNKEDIDVLCDEVYHMESGRMYKESCEGE